MHRQVERTGGASRLAILAISLVMLGSGESGASGEYARPGLLVESQWLDENIIDPAILVVDTRTKPQYDQGHIPNSAWIDEKKLFIRSGEPPYLMEPEAFKSLAESVGIGSGVRVIAVDESGGRSASKLWWVLGYYGFDDVALLNGGFTKWQAEGRAITREKPIARPPVTFTPKPREEWAVTADQLQKLLGQTGVVILDARSSGEFRGRKGIGKRKGHIPGAVNVPSQENMTEDPAGLVFKPQADLLDLYSKAGVTKESKVVAYGRNGRRSTLLLYTLKLIGLNSDGANFVGSWIKWAAKEELPIESPPERERSNSKSKSKSVEGSTEDPD